MQNNLPLWVQKLQKEIYRWKEFTDWATTPLHLLVFGIMLFGAVLMAFSIYTFTQNIFLAIISPVFSEIGIIAWAYAYDKKGINESQKQIAWWNRTIHIGSSVILLIINIVIETVNGFLAGAGYKVEGLIFVVYGIIAIVAIADVWQAYQYEDKDDFKRLESEHSRKKQLMEIQAKSFLLEVEESKQTSELKAQQEYYNEVAPQYFKLAGELDAAKRLKADFEKLGMPKEEIEEILARVRSQTLNTNSPNKNPINNNLSDELPTNPTLGQ